MSASMGPDYYQVPDMFAVASIQVLMMYYLHGLLASMMVMMNTKIGQGIPVSSESKHTFLCLLILDLSQSYSSSAESLIKFIIITIIHSCVIMVIQGIRSSLLFP